MVVITPDTTNEINRLLATGMNPAEVADALGIARATAYYNARKLGWQPSPYEHPHKAEIIAYREQRKSYGWIADKLQMSSSTVRRVCKENGCGGNYSDYKEKAVSRIINALDYGGLCEYVGGYENQNSYIILRCLNCGHEFTKAKATLDHNATNIRCPKCTEAMRHENKVMRDAERKRIVEERKADAAERKRVKAEEKEAERIALKAARKHPCAVCGKETTNPKYCSHKCAGKAESKRREIIRSRKIKNAIVDKDITLQALYKLDNGICHICGGKCDYSDAVEANGVIIAGNNYPSIDHIYPLSKGGKHSWDNVALAHRICNSLKADKTDKAV